MTILEVILLIIVIILITIIVYGYLFFKKAVNEVEELFLSVINGCNDPNLFTAENMQLIYDAIMYPTDFQVDTFNKETYMYCVKLLCEFYRDILVDPDALVIPPSNVSTVSYEGRILIRIHVDSDRRCWLISRGTLPDIKSEVKLNLMIEQVPYDESEAKVQKGYKKVADAIREDLINVLNSLEYDELYLLGDSLGGSVLTILAPVIGTYNQLYANAAPLSSNKDFASLIPNGYYRIINYSDDYGKMPLMSNFNGKDGFWSAGNMVMFQINRNCTADNHTINTYYDGINSDNYTVLYG